MHQHSILVRRDVIICYVDTIAVLAHKRRYLIIKQGRKVNEKWPTADVQYGGGSCSCSSFNLPVTTCWLLGAIVMLSLAFTHQALTGLEVPSRGDSAGTFLSIHRASCRVGWGLCPSLPSIKSDCSACIECHAFRSGHFPNVCKWHFIAL